MQPKDPNAHKATIRPGIPRKKDSAVQGVGPNRSVAKPPIPRISRPDKASSDEAVGNYVPNKVQNVGKGERPDARIDKPRTAPAKQSAARQNAAKQSAAREAPKKRGAPRRPRSVTLNVNATRKLGRYELAFELASGGFAVVYLARVKGPGGFEKFVALKRIHSHMANEKEFVEMFLDEARIAACINHPNVCPVFDFGEADGAYYLAMDYVFGEPLSEVMRSLRKRASETVRASRFPYVARIVADAADGLHAAHEAFGPDGRPLNVVHRDVAPANLFIRFDGHVQVVDFGIASADRKLHMTATGVMKGHLSYVAPEQFRGEDVDRRVDIWSLGVILWEFLTGRRLYKRETDIKTMFAVTDEPYHSARVIDPAVPEALDNIARKALAKNREDRFENARELSRALHQYLRTTEFGVSSHDLGEWVRTVVPGAMEKKQRLLEQARTALRAGAAAPLQAPGRKRRRTGSASTSDPEQSEAGPRIFAGNTGSRKNAKDTGEKEWWANPWFWMALSGVGALGGALWSLLS